MKRICLGGNELMLTAPRLRKTHLYLLIDLLRFEISYALNKSSSYFVGITRWLFRQPVKYNIVMGIKKINFELAVLICYVKVLFSFWLTSSELYHLWTIQRQGKIKTMIQFTGVWANLARHDSLSKLDDWLTVTGHHQFWIGLN